MREPPKYRKGNYDKIIIDALRKKALSRAELLKLHKDEKSLLSQIPYSTFYNRLKQLVKYKVIEHLPDAYRLVAIEEADSKSVLKHLKVLDESDVPSVLEHELHRLCVLASSRVAHISGVLAFCDSALKDPKYRVKNVLKKLVSLLDKLLFFERSRTPVGYETIVKRIQGMPLESLIGILETETDYHVLYEAVEFLANTDREESVNALFRLVERLDDDLYKQLHQSLSQFLFDSDFALMRSQRDRIDQNIVKLLKSDNPKIRERGTEIGNRMH